MKLKLKNVKFVDYSPYLIFIKHKFKLQKFLKINVQNNKAVN